MPQAQQGLFISDPAQIATDAVGAAEIAADSVADSEVAAHTTTKITVPFSLVTGTVPLDQGGTGQTTATPAFDALSPLTTQGDVLYHNGTDNVRLGAGTSGQFLKTQGAGANPIWAAASSTYKNGLTTKNLADASTTQTIAHGISGTPSKVRLDGVVDGSNYYCHSHGSFDASGQSCIGDTGFATQAFGSSTAAIVMRTNGSGTVQQAGVVTVDGTNITITWTKTGSPTGTAQIHWEAFG